MRTRESAVSEADLALIHALQLAPRASWAQLSGALGPSADTLARRWSRLTRDGHAWSGVLPGALAAGSPAACSAWIQVECAVGSIPDTAARLAADPVTLTVQHVTGDADLVLYVACADLTALDRYLTGRVHRLPGVRATRTHIITSVYRAATQPPLGQLTPRQQHRVRELNPRVDRVPRPLAPPDTADQRLLLALAEDGRLGVAALAKRCGASESTVRRRLARMESAGELLALTESAPRVSGRPVWYQIRADVPPDLIASVAAAAARMRETRTVTAVTGPHNLFVCGWLRRVEQLHEYAEKVTRIAPGLRIADTVLSLRVHKIGAHTLSPEGLREHFVPPDIWDINGTA
ncbi:Lrp/AsnC family transcriptional regulator [Streptomyces sp. YJ-C3]